MRNSINILLLFTALAVLAGSCDSPWGCIQGNNRIATENRSTGNFSSVASYGNYVVNVYHGDRTSLSVTADENLLSYIKTSIQGNTLIIETRNDRCLRSAEPVTIDLTTPQVDRLKLAGSGLINANNLSNDEVDLSLSGSGTISCRRLTVDYLRADISGSGLINLSGIANTTDFLVSGSGQIKAIDLESLRCYATISGSGNIYTSAEELIDVSISGSGNLYYKGNPEIRKDISGSGDVREYK